MRLSWGEHPSSCDRPFFVKKGLLLLIKKWNWPSFLYKQRFIQNVVFIASGTVRVTIWSWNLLEKIILTSILWISSLYLAIKGWSHGSDENKAVCKFIHTEILLKFRSFRCPYQVSLPWNLIMRRLYIFSKFLVAFECSRDVDRQYQFVMFEAVYPIDLK